jgi:hypothetical protein
MEEVVGPGSLYFRYHFERFFYYHVQKADEMNVVKSVLTSLCTLMLLYVFPNHRRILLEEDHESPMNLGCSYGYWDGSRESGVHLNDVRLLTLSLSSCSCCLDDLTDVN